MATVSQSQAPSAGSGFSAYASSGGYSGWPACGGIVFPWSSANRATTSIAIFTLLYAAAGALEYFSGYTGYIALGHAAFFGIGCYAIALMCQHWDIPGLGAVPARAGGGWSRRSLPCRWAGSRCAPAGTRLW